MPIKVSKEKTKSTTNTMTQEMIENIKQYGQEIITIEEFIQAVRQNPGQYIGYLGNKGFINMIREVFQNSIDELMKNDSPCTHIIVSYDERNHTVIIEDNGRGIPYDNMVRIFTSANTSSNYVKKDGEFSSGLHGVGSKVTNALSSVFIVDSYILGECRHIEFYDGRPWDKGEVPEPNKENRQGTRILFRPSYEYMGEITITCKEVLSLIQKLVPLTKIGASVDFNGITLDGKIIHEKVVNEDGIITYLINKTGAPLIKPVTMQLATGKMKAEIAFTYDSNDLMNEDITSFSNFCPTIGGTHLDGFLDGITNFFRKYMNTVFLANSKKVQVVNSDIKSGLKAIVSVAHIKPIFSGQAKEILANDDMHVFVKKLVINSLDNWLKENPGDVKKLCTYFKSVAELRMKSDEGRIKLSNSYKTSSLTGMPKKYVKPIGKGKLPYELIIVEGDSAMGSIRNSRNEVLQGIFPIRGKIPNAMDKTKKEFLENEEVAAMLSIFGCGYGKNCDVSKMKWDKIIIGTDADPDGAHIRVLLLKFILVYCPQIIEAGKLYSAVPPLYGIVKSKGKGKKHDNMQYFTDKIDYIRYIQNLFSSKNDLKDASGNNMTKAEITAILYNNMDYVKTMDNISNTYAINPYLLEFVLANIALPFNKFKKAVEKKYRFLKVEDKGNTVLIEGLVDSKYQTIFLNDNMIQACTPLTNYINKSPLMYTLNGEKISLYGLMRKFDENSPKDIQRYKGLGEMAPWKLFESTFDPNGERTLMRFTMEDVKAELEAIRVINSDLSVLLNDIKISKEDVL